MRLAATTDEHFTIEQIVQICGYPTTCTWMHQPLRCFAWIQDMQLLQASCGQALQALAYSLVSSEPCQMLSLTAPLCSPHLGLYQTTVQVRKVNMDQDHEEDDTQSLMAQGSNTRPKDPEPFLIDNPAIVQQDEGIEDDLESNDSIESSDPDWQEATIFSPRSAPVTRQINLQSHPLRRYQIAHALRWVTDDVMEDYSLAVGPEAMEVHPCYAWLVRHQRDLPSHSNLVLVLIDIIMHPFPPSWQIQTVRKPMYVFRSLQPSNCYRLCSFGATVHMPNYHLHCTSQLGHLAPGLRSKPYRIQWRLSYHSYSTSKCSTGHTPNQMCSGSNAPRVLSLKSWSYWVLSQTTMFNQSQILIRR